MVCLLAALLLGVIPLVEDGDIKKAITTFEQQIEHAPRQERAVLKGKLAIIYYRDQEHERAFQVFLDALDDVIHDKQHQATSDEARLYSEALELYLEHGTASAQSTATKILQRYAPILDQEENYHLLRYILAAAYANLGRFEDFFDHFFTSYSFYPEHYMAKKTRAVLHIKLYERARTSLEREYQRNKILSHVLSAIEKYPQDHSLYKLMVAFSSEEDKKTYVNTYLNKIVENNIIIPRSEIPFYVQQCVETRQKELARRFIIKAREWYQYSRAIDIAERMLIDE